jgi:hypothetical protein
MTESAAMKRVCVGYPKRVFRIEGGYQTAMMTEPQLNPAAHTSHPQPRNEIAGVELNGTNVIGYKDSFTNSVKNCFTWP